MTSHCNRYSYGNHYNNNCDIGWYNGSFGRSVAIAFLLWLRTGTSGIMSSSISPITHNTSVDNINNNEGAGIVSIKLIPRHAELNRRRRERARNILEVNDADVDAEKEAEEKFRRRDEAVQVGALFEGYGTHYVDLWCGSPPQRQTVIVDTGSGITAFPCSGCKDCGVPTYHIDRLFVEDESSTFETATCQSSADCVLARSNCQGSSCKVSMAYAEGSRWNAYEGVDRCYVAGPHEIPLVTSEGGANIDGDDLNPRHAADLAFDMAFGCQTLVTGLFKTQLADGIMGMSNQASTYWSQMFKAGKMGKDKRFALCFSRPPSVTREGTEAGALTLGGVDERLHLSPMVFTPSASGGRASFFSVKIRRMMLREGQYGESALSNDKNPNKGITVLDLDEGTLNKGGAIVDSGTTDTYWNSGIKTEFQRVFTKLAGRAHSNQALHLSERDFKKLPTILFQLYSDDKTNSHISDMFHTAGLAGALDNAHKSDVILAIPPSHYMEYNPEKDTYTSRFYPTERSGSVLGANAMMGHDILFDVDNNRIGWAESTCDYTSTVEQNGYEFEIDGALKDVEETGKGEGGGGLVPDPEPADPEPAGCESYKSGSKCPIDEGCSWYWGKCTKSGEVSPDTPSPTTVELETLPPTAFEDDDTKITPQADITFNTVMSQMTELLDGNEVVVVGSIVALTFICFLLYCCCCRQKSSSGAKYSRASLEPSTIELTNGRDIDIDSFSDEPPPKEINGGSVGSKSSSSSKKFRDRPDDEPEFDGDFA